MISHISAPPRLLKGWEVCQSYHLWLLKTDTAVCVWPDLLQCQKRKTTPALASAGELTIDAVHSTDQTELQIIPAFFAMVTRSTGCH